MENLWKIKRFKEEAHMLCWNHPTNFVDINSVEQTLIKKKESTGDF